MTQSPAQSTTSLQDAVAPYLNRWGPYRLTRDEVSEVAIRRFCEVAEDANPVYWDREFAEKSRFGRIIAPPQSIFSMTFAPWWTPGYLAQQVAEDAAQLNPADLEASGPSAHQLSDEHGYTVATVVAQEVEYVSPFGPGDGRLKMRGMTTDVSLEKQTKVGKGIFITSVTEYRTEADDRLVARSTMVLLKYNGNSPRGE